VRKRARFLIHCGALLASSLPLLAAGITEGQSTWQQIGDRGVLRVGLPGDYAPYALNDADGPRGVDVSLAREIAASLGLGIEFVPTSWGSLMADARAGRFDIAAGGISITAQRNREQRFTRAYLRDHKAPLVRCGDESRFDSLREINSPSVRVVVNPGGTNERFARREFPAAELTVHPGNRTVAEEILRGREDVFVTDEVEGRLLSSLHGSLCVAAKAPDWEPVGKGFMVVADEAARRKLDAALGSALRQEAIASRLRDWQRHDWQADESGSAAPDLARLADLRLGVVTEVARWKWNRQAPIEDRPREASLLAALLSAAAERGIPATRVEAFFGAQIEAAKQLQRDLFALWREQGAGQFTGVADLDTQLRPRIDAINVRMLEALGRWDGMPVDVRRLGPLGTGRLSPDAQQSALAPLAHGQGTPADSSGL
jgi:chorismate mutase-like protein